MRPSARADCQVAQTSFDEFLQRHFLHLSFSSLVVALKVVLGKNLLDRVPYKCDSPALQLPTSQMRNVQRKSMVGIAAQPPMMFRDDLSSMIQRKFVVFQSETAVKYDRWKFLDRICRNVDPAVFGIWIWNQIVGLGFSFMGIPDSLAGRLRMDPHPYEEGQWICESGFTDCRD